MVRAGVAALCLVLVACVGLGSCTKCYQCSSASDSKCTETFNSKNSLRDCTDISKISQFNVDNLLSIDSQLAAHDASKPRYCYKLITERNVVIRSCFDTDPAHPNATCSRAYMKNRDSKDPSIQIKHCSYCNEDNCNGAGAPIASLFLALSVSVLLAYSGYRQ